jgi:mono/diheme cytochrome c family protein
MEVAMVGRWMSALAVLSLIVVADRSAEARDLAAEGHEIVSKSCSKCHAVDPEGNSPHKEAPPFRNVVTKDPAETLAVALVEGITTRHPDMPLITFEPEQIEAIIAYLSTLGETPVPPEEESPEANSAP